MAQKIFGENGYQRVFFSIAQTKENVSAQSPIEIGTGEIYGYLVDVAQCPNNFIGFTDSEGTTIQFMVDEFDKIWLDIPSVKDHGSYGKYFTNAEMTALVDGLTAPYNKYVKELNLELLKW
ncbi:hypothetical protein L4174_009635 [Photobacterium sp. CCB-ST2H9]|uniref:hypothetical protein n=1 Tax=Photobacterium sp. CCB-ST2H9 TaxID=2912855 RepID=UPI0020032F09|nr:hypothetical protein [Photobacterium sp. CCB-ST2H9]UTM56109.1 hypothetical protein L4174_009635 [Photobacterium sp. CCB-ST2H9]